LNEITAFTQKQNVVGMKTKQQSTQSHPITTQALHVFKLSMHMQSKNFLNRLCICLTIQTVYLR